MSVLEINTNEDYETYILNDVDKLYDYTCLILNKPYIVKDEDCFKLINKYENCNCCMCYYKDDDHICNTCEYISYTCPDYFYVKNNITYNYYKIFNKYCYLSLKNTFKNKEKYKNFKNIIILNCTYYEYYIPILKNFNKLDEIIINFDNQIYNYKFFEIFNNNFINIKKLTINSINGFKLDFLKYLNNLEYLEIANQIIKEFDLSYISKKCKQLKTLICNAKIYGLEYTYKYNDDNKIKYGITHPTDKLDIGINFYKSIIKEILPQLSKFNSITFDNPQLLQNKINYNNFDKYVIKNSNKFNEYYTYEKLYKYLKEEALEKMKIIYCNDNTIDYKDLYKYSKMMCEDLLKDNKIKLQKLYNNIKCIHKKNNFDDVFNISNLYVEYDFKQMKESKKELHLEFKYMYKYYVKSLYQKKFINDILD